jgi:trehalose-phosphatase
MFSKGTDDPQAEALLPELHRAMRELGKRAHTVIVSGRTLADLTARTKGAVPYLIGHHGLEGAEVAASVGARAQEVCTGWKRQLDSELGDRLQALGVQTDDKIYSLSFGYASDPRNPLVRGTILELLHHLTPIPRVILGRKMVHALPPGLPHKGVAMMDLMLKLRLNAALYLGDPETGEELFEMTDRLVVTVRVKAKRRSWAPFYLKGHREIAPAVTLIVRSLDRRAAAADRQARGAISMLSTGLNG